MSADGHCCAASTPTCSCTAGSAGWCASCAPRVRDRGERRSRSLLGRLRTRLTEVPAPEEAAPAAEVAYEYESPPAEPVYEEPAPEPVYVPEPEAPPAISDEPAPPRSVHAVPTNADLKVARAVELFNTSEHPRTVSGVARSLGAP